MSDSGYFALWVVVGCALALGLISFAVGPLVIVPAAVAAVVLLRNPNARRSADGGLVGIGLLLLFVAYVNRDGTGCCNGNLNPLPWLALGVAFVAGGFLAHRLRRQ